MITGITRAIARRESSRTQPNPPTMFTATAIRILAIVTVTAMATTVTNIRP